MESDYNNVVGIIFLKFIEMGNFFNARVAPNSPEIDYNYLFARIIRKPEFFFISVTFICGSYKFGTSVARRSRKNIGLFCKKIIINQYEYKE